MLLAIGIGIGIPGLVLGIYAWGRANYGEQWYLAFGPNSTYGADDPIAQEIEDARFTSLHLNNPEAGSASSDATRERFHAEQ